MGSRLKGVYHLVSGEVHVYEPGRNFTRQDSTILPRWTIRNCKARIGADMLKELREELETRRRCLASVRSSSLSGGKQSPVFFGSAVNNFGVQPLLDFFVQQAPGPKAHATTTRLITASEDKLSGFVFKIQANMDPMHRDRVAFMRICFRALRWRHEGVPRAQRQGNEIWPMR